MKQETSPLPEEEGQGIAEEGPRATGTPEDRLRVPVVGIGASAGGLEALSALVAGLDPEPPQAYVVLQHVSPEHRSMLVDILSRDTALTVEAMTDGTVPRPGRVYVVPATSVATVRDGRFALNNATPDATPKPSINEFLASLASEAEEMAVGVVLSGTGSDGTAGLRAIQAAGGVTLVQQPETAKYPGMPMSAIEAGVADYLLPPEEIAQRLGELARLHATRDNGVPREFLDRLMAMVQSHRQIDFSEYKASTLARRVKRRVVATGAESPEDYLRWAENHPEELNLLIRDILISVTAFFRDAEAFQALDGVIDRICAAKGEGEEIRLWVAGCATGEEAYSIAIQLAEAMRNQGRINPVQVFATDIDDEALEVARRGVYPAAALDKVPRHLVERYFRPLRDNQEVGKQLRDMVVFARHNLVDDPPFLRTDLVTCRNVLIYFDATLQAKVLRRFHFSLMEGGYLFLGRSESAAAASDHFDTLNRRESIYRKREEAEDSGNRQWLAPQRPKRPATSPQQQRKQAAQVMLETLASRFGATVALCDEDGNIQHTAGNIESFFRFPRGDMRMTLGDVLVEPFRGEAVAILYRLEQDEQTSQRGQAHEIDGVRYRLSVERQTQHAANHLLLVIAPVAESVAVSAGGELPDADTDPETLDAVAQNRALVEQLATANEEMQSLNEEAQASNEELQATNEELEAANEELQASNEELVSVNEELNVKASELTALTEEYQHLYDSMGFPVLVFDRLCYLRRFNREAQDRFRLKSTALGQPLSGLDLPTYFAGLADHLSQALAHGGTREEQITAGERQHFKLQVTPGLDQAGEVELLVVALMDVSDVVRVEEELEAYRQRLQSLMENTTILLAMKDLRGRYVYANPRFLEVFELDPTTYEGRTDFELFPRSFAAELWARDVEAMQSDDSIDVEHILGGDDAPERIFHTVHQPMRDEEGHPVMLITESEEVTQRKRAEEQLRIAARVFENAGEAIVVTDETGGVQSINNAFTRITGYTEKDALGRNLGRLLKSGRHSKLFYNEMWKSLNENGCWQGEIWNRRKDGEIYPEWLSINRIDDENDLTQHFVAVFSDISSLKNNQRKVEYLANHDVLTGLPNRSLFQDRLDQAIALAQRNGSEVALLFVDLDNFKSINDTLGHDVGDELLVQVAARLQEVLREVDTVARVGGDEFTVILAECDRSGAAEVAQRIIDGVSGHFPVQGRDLVVGASLGMAFYPQDGEDGKTLAKAADTAMYQSKEDGRNQFQTFRAELHEQLLARTNLEEALRRALREDELRLVYQPKFALDGGGAIVGAEALLRWHTPGRGAISPGEFIPVAEQSRLIVDLSYHVEELLVAQIQAWREAGLEPPPVAFNVSAKCFRERGYAEQLFGRLERSGVPLAGVQIEITEGTFLEQSEHIDTNIARLQEAGIALSIDDFGTGFSSLTNLKKLPVREIKIDKTFVDGLGSDENDEAIARASLAMARALGVRTVAEGVETTGQQNWLREQGCDHVQGFLLARPLEAADFVELLRARTAS